MPLWLPPNAGVGSDLQTNVTVSARDGTTITAGGSANTKGAYSAGELIASTNEDTYGVTIRVGGLAAQTTSTKYLLDIGMGASGSEVDLIPNINCDGASAIASSRTCKVYYFPIFIPRGRRVAARAAAVTASDTASVSIYLHQNAAGWGMEVPTLWESLGVGATSGGTSVASGSGAFGSWTTILDPITKNYKWWHIGMDGLADTSWTAMTYLWELGFGDTSAAVTSIGTWQFGTDASEEMGGPWPYGPVYFPVIADTVNGVFARAAAGGTEARGIIVYAAQ